MKNDGRMTRNEVIFLSSSLSLSSLSLVTAKMPVKQKSSSKKGGAPLPTLDDEKCKAVVYVEAFKG